MTDGVVRLDDQEVPAARLARATVHARRLDSYLRALGDVRSAGPGRQDLSPGLAARAYAAERHARALIHDTLATLNDLRDTGELERVFSEVVANEGRGFPEGLAEAPFVAAEACGIPRDRVEELFPSWRDLPLQVTVDAENVIVSGRALDGRGDERRVTFRGYAAPGDIGRLSTSELFAADHYRILGVTARDPDARQARDVYGAAVANLVQVKETMYAHARRVDELGPWSIRGAEPTTGLGLFLAFVGFVLVLVGVVENVANPGKGNDKIGFGAVLLASGLCLIIGWCSETITKDAITITPNI